MFGTIFSKMLCIVLYKNRFFHESLSLLKTYAVTAVAYTVLFEWKQVFNVYCMTPFRVNKYCYMQKVSARDPKRH